MSDANDLARRPTDELTEALTTVADASKLSQSFARADFPQEDGSYLIAYSFQGGDTGLAVFAPDEEPIVNPPVSPDAIPEGIQNDGRNTYDETGPPEGLVDVEA